MTEAEVLEAKAVTFEKAATRIDALISEGKRHLRVLDCCARLPERRRRDARAGLCECGRALVRQFQLLGLWRPEVYFDLIVKVRGGLLVPPAFIPNVPELS